MKKSGADLSRRRFVGALATGALAAGATPIGLSAQPQRDRHILTARRHQSVNDQIQLAVIGAGGMGMADVRTALRVPGVKLVAAADCFDGRLEDANVRYSLTGGLVAETLLGAAFVGGAVGEDGSSNWFFSLGKTF